jgi:hypothetical protein
MKLNSWGRAATFVLLLSVISLPAWAKKHEHRDYDDPKPSYKQVPEGGSAYLYVALSGLAMFGGMLLAKKKRSGAVCPPQS